VIDAPGGYYYEMNNYPSLDYATRGIAQKLAQYDEPVGILIDNGGHYVLATGVDSNLDPNIQGNFWTMTISNVYIRDPWVPVA
jgi:hypothetical protein